VVVLLALPAVAAAAPDLIEARKHHARGEAFLKSEEFREAIVEFEEAFRWSGQPEMLYNIGKVYRRLGMVEGGTAVDLDRAVDNFRRFLALRPRDRDREHIEKWLDEMSLRAARLRAAAPPARRPEAPRRPAGARATASSAPPVADAAGAAELAPAPVAAPAPARRGARPLGAEVGLSLAIAVGAASTALGAYALSQDGAPACHPGAPGAHCPALVDSALTGGLLVGIGGALAVGAAAALAVVEVRARRGERGERPAALGVAPVLLPGGAGLCAVTRF